MIIVWDTETDRFAPANMAPSLVSVAWTTIENGQQSEPQIINHWDASAWVRWAHSTGALTVGQNVAYDWAVLCSHDESLVPLVFEFYTRSLVTDTMWRQKLADIGRGKYRGFFNGPVWIPTQYDLGAIGKRHGFPVDKEDPWRLHYSLLREIPVEQWGQQVFENVPVEVGKGKSQHVERRTLYGRDALTYALRDPGATGVGFLGQAARYSPDLLVDEYQKAREFFALQLASVWGLRTSARGVASLRAGAQEKLDDLLEFLVGEQLVRPTGVRDTKAAARRMVAAHAALGTKPRYTKTGVAQIKQHGRLLDPDKGIELSADACLNAQDPVLEAYAEYSSIMKVLSADVGMLARGIEYPVHCHFDLLDTGRKGASKPNTQNPRRLPGVRECFVPRGFPG